MEEPSRRRTINPKTQRDEGECIRIVNINITYQSVKVGLRMASPNVSLGTPHVYQHGLMAVISHVRSQVITK